MHVDLLSAKGHVAVVSYWQRMFVLLCPRCRHRMFDSFAALALGSVESRERRGTQVCRSCGQDELARRPTRAAPGWSMEQEP